MKETKKMFVWMLGGERIKVILQKKKSAKMFV